MDRGQAFSIVLLFLALLIAVTQSKMSIVKSLFQSVNYYLLVMGFLTGMLASVVEAFKSNFLLRQTAESSMEYMQAMPSITVSGDVQLVEKFSSWLTSGITKTLGKAMLVFSKILGVGFKLIAAVCGLIYLFFPRPELLGLWIVLSTILALVLFKFSGVVSFLVPGGSYSAHTKKLLAVAALLGLVAWTVSAGELFFFFSAFPLSNPVSLIGLFFFFALLTLFSLTPFTFDGLGAIELVGMGLFFFLGVPLLVSFFCLVLWEAAKLVGDFVVSLLPPPRPELGPDLAEYK